VVEPVLAASDPGPWAGQIAFASAERLVEGEAAALVEVAGTAVVVAAVVVVVVAAAVELGAVAAAAAAAADVAEGAAAAPSFSVCVVLSMPLQI